MVGVYLFGSGLHLALGNLETSIATDGFDYNLAEILRLGGKS
jgi:hypothetical protein